MEQIIDDRGLRDEVIKELEFEPRIDAAHIAVAAEKSMVVLFGHVSTLSEKTPAEEAARRVRGVCARAVHEERPSQRLLERRP